MCVRVDRNWDRVTVCTYGQNLGSGEFVYVWTKFGIVSVCVRVDKFWDPVSVCTCGHSVLLSVNNCMWTEFRIV